MTSEKPEKPFQGGKKQFLRLNRHKKNKQRWSLKKPKMYFFEVLKLARHSRTIEVIRVCNFALSFQRERKRGWAQRMRERQIQFASFSRHYTEVLGLLTQPLVTTFLHRCHQKKTFLVNDGSFLLQRTLEKNPLH